MSEHDDAAYIQHLESKVAELEKEIARLRKEKGLSSVGDGLTFNQKTGTYVEVSSGLHHCPKCLAKDKRHPLAAEDDQGWHCSVCDAYYGNPDAPPPEAVYFRPGQI